MRELKIMDSNWDGIFLNETEAAAALAFGKLPDRILGDWRVNQSIRDRCASSQEEKEGMLQFNKLDLAFWEESTTFLDDRWTREGLVHVEVYCTGTYSRSLETRVKSFRMSIGGRGYDKEELGLITELTSLAHRLMVIAEYSIENRLLAQRISKQ